MPTHPSPTFPAPRAIFKLGAWAAALLVTAGFGLTSDSAQAQAPLPVPNFSFENPSAVGFPFGTNPSITDWAKNLEPAYWSQPPFSTPFPWPGTSGVFVGTAPNSPNPYTNLLGTQAGYILGFPGAALFQNNFAGNFEIGETYTFTLGVFGKPSLPASAQLRLSFYYRDTTNTTNDPLGEKTVFSQTVIPYSTATFDDSQPNPSLIDYSVSTSVLASDAWAGRPVGIMMDTVDPNPTGGNWDFDNARLVPEPATTGLMAMAFSGLLLRRRRGPGHA